MSVMSETVSQSSVTSPAADVAVQAHATLCPWAMDKLPRSRSHVRRRVCMPCVARQIGYSQKYCCTQKGTSRSPAASFIDVSDDCLLTVVSLSGPVLGSCACSSCQSDVVLLRAPDSQTEGRPACAAHSQDLCIPPTHIQTSISVTEATQT